MISELEKTHYLHAMGITRWVCNTRVSHTISLTNNGRPHIDDTLSGRFSSDTRESTAKRLPIQDTVEDQWNALATCVAQCQACELHKTRTQTVFGTGHFSAHLMIVGEAPGAHEDKQGLPFVGRAGLLLNNMLKAIGFEREQVFIANILKCRPPNNRDPRPNEIQECQTFLKQQINLVQPRLILILGRIAAHALLQTTRSLGSLRQQFFTYGEKNIPLLVSYHPAYLLRNPIDKGKAYQDLKKVYQWLQQDIK